MSSKTDVKISDTSENDVKILHRVVLVPWNRVVLHPLVYRGPGVFLILCGFVVYTTERFMF